MIVGKPLQILMAYTTAIIQCQCAATPIIMLAALHRPVQCPGCGKRWAIAKAGSIEIGEVVGGVAHDPQPAGLVS
jgi:hypothetical protein